MNADRKSRIELHKKFGIALEKNPEILKQIEDLCTKLDLKGKTFKENVQLFSEKLDIPYDYILQYINRKVSEEIKRRLKAKGRKSYDVRNDFCHNDKTFEENVLILAKELEVLPELVFSYAWRFDEVSIVACRLYENKIDCRDLLADKKVDREKEMERVSHEINMSHSSLEKFSECLSRNL